MRVSGCTRVFAFFRNAYWIARLRLDASRSGATLRLDPSVRLRTRVIFKGRGALTIGPDVVLGDSDAGQPGVPIYLSPRAGDSRILIGARSRVANGLEIVSLRKVLLGAGCLIGPGVRIVDADFHGVPVEERHQDGLSAPVNIGENVWLGMGVTILKGVRIGDGAVVGAGAVVVNDVPGGAVVAGNPARVVARADRANVAAAQ